MVSLPIDPTRYTLGLGCFSRIRSGAKELEGTKEDSELRKLQTRKDGGVAPECSADHNETHIKELFSLTDRLRQQLPFLEPAYRRPHTKVI